MFNIKNILEDPRVTQINFNSYNRDAETDEWHVTIWYQLPKSGYTIEVEGCGRTRDEAIVDATTDTEEYLQAQETRLLMSDAERAYVAYYKNKGSTPLDWKDVPNEEVKIWEMVANSITGKYDC